MGCFHNKYQQRHGKSKEKLKDKEKIKSVEDQKKHRNNTLKIKPENKENRENRESLMPSLPEQTIRNSRPRPLNIGGLNTKKQKARVDSMDNFKREDQYSPFSQDFNKSETKSQFRSSSIVISKQKNSQPQRQKQIPEMRKTYQCYPANSFNPQKFNKELEVVPESESIRERSKINQQTTEQYNNGKTDQKINFKKNKLSLSSSDALKKEKKLTLTK